MIPIRISASLRYLQKFLLSPPKKPFTSKIKSAFLLPAAEKNLHAAILCTESSHASRLGEFGGGVSRRRTAMVRRARGFPLLLLQRRNNAEQEILIVIYDTPF